MRTKKDTFLHQTENGHVLKCNCCNEIQIAFGNIFLKYNYNQFISFKQSIDNAQINYSNKSKHINNKQYVLNLPSNIAIGFTVAEIIELRQLLLESEMALTISHLLLKVGLN